MSCVHTVSVARVDSYNTAVWRLQAMEEQQALLDSMTAQKQERTEMMQREREARDVAAAAQVRQARLTASARVFSTCWATRTRAARSGGGGGKTDKAGRRLNWSRCFATRVRSRQAELLRYRQSLATAAAAAGTPPPEVRLLPLGLSRACHERSDI